MAERQASKARKSAGKSAGRSALTAAGRLDAQVLDLETERDRLKAELIKARARIASLEQSRELVLNRIDWVIDSLHNLIEE